MQKYGFPHEDTDEFISSINNVIVSAVSAAERYHDYKGEGPLAGLLEHLSKHCMAEIEKLPPTKKETDRWIRLVNKLAELWCRHLGEIPEKKLPVPRQRWERLGETPTPDTAPFKSVLHIVIRGVEACYFRKKEIVTPAKIDRWATDAINKLSDKKK